MTEQISIKASLFLVERKKYFSKSALAITAKLIKNNTYIRPSFLLYQ